MSARRRIRCTLHGVQQRAYVCQHLLASISSGVPVGWHCTDDGEQSSHAWCSACEAAWEEADNECTPEVAAFLGLKVVCAACHDCAKDIWLARGKPQH